MKRKELLNLISEKSLRAYQIKKKYRKNDDSNFYAVFYMMKYMDKILSNKRASLISYKNLIGVFQEGKFGFSFESYIRDKAEFCLSYSLTYLIDLWIEKSGDDRKVLFSKKIGLMTCKNDIISNFTHGLCHENYNMCFSCILRLSELDNITFNHFSEYIDIIHDFDELNNSK